MRSDHLGNGFSGNQLRGIDDEFALGGAGVQLNKVMWSGNSTAVVPAGQTPDVVGNLFNYDSPGGVVGRSGRIPDLRGSGEVRNIAIDVIFIDIYAHEIDRPPSSRVL